MRFSARPFALIAVCGLVLACTACGSRNKGKIEGKWKLVSAPGVDEKQVAEADQRGMYMYFEFKPDGSVNVGLGSTKADEKNGEAGLAMEAGKYKLLSGHKVEFSGMKGDGKKDGGGLFGKGDKSVVEVKVDGDNMTITGSDGTGKLVRVK
jgi:hypothetical protein